MNWCHFMVLICICLKNKNCVWFLTYLLAIFMSSLEKCLQGWSKIWWTFKFLFKDLIILYKAKNNGISVWNKRSILRENGGSMSFNVKGFSKACILYLEDTLWSNIYINFLQIKTLQYNFIQITHKKWKF